MEEKEMEMETKTVELGHSVERGDIRVEWDDLGESIDGGDWEDDEPIENSVLRFYVRKRSDEAAEYGDGFEDIEDASYATSFPAETSTMVERDQALRLILDKVYDSAAAGESIKKICERLSWIDLSWVNPTPEDTVRIESWLSARL
jgi:hypothetical protein